MKIIYFHGLGSEANCEKVTLLKKAGFDVYAPSINIDPEIAESELTAFIIKVISDTHIGEPVVFVGTSLGGFWAARMNKHFDAYTVLINPRLQPYYSLLRHFYPKEIADKYAKYPYETEDRYRAYFIALNDTPIPNMKEAKLFTYDSDDHRGMSFMADVIEFLRTIPETTQAALF